MDDEVRELMDKVAGFFDKKGVALESKYFVCKRMSDDYFADIWSDEDSVEEDVLDDGFEFEKDSVEEDVLDDGFEFEEDSVEEDSVEDEVVVPYKVPRLNSSPGSIKAKLKGFGAKSVKGGV